MDKFLEITFENQILATKDGDKFVEYFAPFMEKLKGIVSAELYEEFDELLNGCANQNNIFYGVQGMKLAMGVLDGTYQLTVQEVQIMSDVMTVRKSWNRKDITGQTFGYLTAIGYDHFDGNGI